MKQSMLDESKVFDMLQDSESKLQDAMSSQMQSVMHNLQQIETKVNSSAKQQSSLNNQVSF